MLCAQILWSLSQTIVIVQLSDALSFSDHISVIQTLRQATASIFLYFSQLPWKEPSQPLFLEISIAFSSVEVFVLSHQKKGVLYSISFLCQHALNYHFKTWQPEAEPGCFILDSRNRLACGPRKRQAPETWNSYFSLCYQESCLGWGQKVAYAFFSFSQWEVAGHRSSRNCIHQS